MLDLRKKILVLLCSAGCIVQAQSIYPKGYFRYPMDLPPAFAGTFGEPRPNHFHSGVDFRTNQREGYPVYAVADGFISRMRVQIGGFGQALYIDHPNGFTSVYAHLQSFNPKIAGMVKDFQYRLQSFEVDIPLIFSEIPVKKGELIGRSGNTGSSAGPHLHFEIRDTKTEETINPQLFGLSIPDKVSPEIKGLYLYHLNEEAFSEQIRKQFFAVTGSMGKYRLLSPKPIILNGESGFGISTLDRSIPGGTTYGVYQIQLLLDEKPVYTATWDRFSFDDTRGANAHLDYPALKGSGQKIHKSFIEPGNPLDIYKSIQRGLIDLQDEKPHRLSYVISDVAGNQSTLSFEVQLGDAMTKDSPNDKTVFHFNKNNTYSNGDIELTVPQGALYSDIRFDYAVAPQLAGMYSAQHRIHKATTPLHIPATLSIKPYASTPKQLLDKLVMVDGSGAAQNSILENGMIKAQIKNFGFYYLKADTLAPRISPININDGKTMTGYSRILFKIADQLSGIATFSGKIDGQWVLMEYDLKSNSLWHTFDGRFLPGKHQLELSVTDKKENTSIYKANFNY
jgi:hypothetical protein